MVVKEKAGRSRYIAFRLEPGSAAAREKVSRRLMIRAIKQGCDALGPGTFSRANPWLTKFDGTRGIVRCPHTAKDLAIRALQATALSGPAGLLRVVTLGTSGTIKRARIKYFGPDWDDGSVRGQAKSGKKDSKGRGG